MDVMKDESPRRDELAVATSSSGVRASDQDRDHAVELLNEHAVAGRLSPEELQQRTETAYGARTIGGLARLLDDLPGQYVPAALADGGRTPRRWFTAIMGSSRRRSRFRLARRATCLAIMASPDINLCDAELDGDEIEIKAYAFFGWPDIYLPDSVRVELSGASLFGGDAERGSRHEPRAGATVIRIRCYALIGGYTVWRLPPELQDLPPRRARQAARALPSAELPGRADEPYYRAVRTACGRPVRLRGISGGRTGAGGPARRRRCAHWPSPPAGPRPGRPGSAGRWRAGSRSGHGRGRVLSR